MQSNVTSINEISAQDIEFSIEDSLFVDVHVFLMEIWGKR